MHLAIRGPPDVFYHETAVGPCKHTLFNPSAAFSCLKPNRNSPSPPKGGALLLWCALFREGAEDNRRTLSAKRQQHGRGKGRVNTKAVVNEGVNGPPAALAYQLQEKSQEMLEEPLRPRLPASRIPMKKSDTRAAYQRLLSLPHFSAHRSTNAKPDRLRRR